MILAMGWSIGGNIQSISTYFNPHGLMIQMS